MGLLFRRRSRSKELPTSEKSRQSGGKGKANLRSMAIVCQDNIQNKDCLSSQTDRTVVDTTSLELHKAPKIKGVLKVLTLEESLASCCSSSSSHCEKRKSRRESFFRRRASGHRSSSRRNSSLLLATLVRVCSSVERDYLDSNDQERQGGDNNHNNSNDHTTTETNATIHDDDPNNKQKKKSVQFDSLHCRLYSVVPDVNPSTSVGGAAIAMGWDYREGARWSVEEFESRRPPRRAMEDIRLSAQERERRLRAAGATEKELRRARKAIAVARRRRRQTMKEMTAAKKKKRECDGTTQQRRERRRRRSHGSSRL